MQCPKLSFNFVHSQGALPIKLCTRKLLHAPSQYIAMINGSRNVHTPGAHFLKSCTRPRKCARQVQGAPLISDTVNVITSISVMYKIHLNLVLDLMCVLVLYGYKHPHMCHCVRLIYSSTYENRNSMHAVTSFYKT